MSFFCLQFHVLFQLWHSICSPTVLETSASVGLGTWRVPETLVFQLRSLVLSLWEGIRFLILQDPLRPLGKHLVECHPLQLRHWPQCTGTQLRLRNTIHVSTSGQYGSLKNMILHTELFSMSVTVTLIFRHFRPYLSWYAPVAISTEKDPACNWVRVPPSNPTGTCLRTNSLGFGSPLPGRC